MQLTLILGLVGLSALIGATVNDPLLPAWGQLGVLGLLILAFFTDRIVTGSKYNQVVKERNEERARTEKAGEKLDEKFLPALLETQLALRIVNDQTMPMLKDLRELLDEWKASK